MICWPCAAQVLPALLAPDGAAGGRGSGAGGTIAAVIRPPRRQLRRVVPLCLAAALASAGTAVAGSVEPRTVVTSFRATLTSERAVDALTWQAPDSLAVRPVRGDSLFGRLVERAGTTWFRYGPGSPGSRLRRQYPARPEAFSSLEQILLGRDFVLARARAGRGGLVEATLDGRPMLRARVRLAPNDCAALGRGMLELWLDPATLLPVRVSETRGGAVRYVHRLAYTDLDATLPPSRFAPIPLGRRPFRDDLGFRRVPPDQAATHLDYVPELPAVVPDGFTLATTGWAPRSGITGPEGSNPPYDDLFAAVYRRGTEHVDVTQRLGTGEDWPSDPFGGECLFEFVEQVRIGDVSGVYATAPQVPPHLYWRRGRVLHTLSGPFPRAELVAIAESLAPVTSGAGSRLR
jgi:hypothetical protein